MSDEADKAQEEEGVEDLLTKADARSENEGDDAPKALMQTEFKPREKVVPRKIIDADGDGVEDNRKVSRKWLDKFGKKIYGHEVDDIYNTHNGFLPGQERHGEDPAPKSLLNIEA